MLPNQDKLTNSVRTMSFDKVMEIETTDGYGYYDKSRVSTPVSPVVIRRNSPEGATYQEAVGYTFLPNVVAFPGLGRMDDGTLVLTLSAEKGRVEREREEFLLFSKDEGRSWTQPRWVPGYRLKPFNLGGKRLMLRGAFPLGDGNRLVLRNVFRIANEDTSADCLRFSEDAGQTWGDPEPMPELPDGHPFYTDVAYTHLVEGNTITFAGSTRTDVHANWQEGNLFTQGVIRRYHLDTRTWDEPHLFPRDWALNEGSLVRASNGDLVAAFRTQMVGVPIHSDHEMGLATLRSTDNGKTWSQPAHHFLYGYHHCGLILLADGRILMTYAARIGELDGMTYHGVEAVLSSDHGVTWDWGRRWILFRWPHPSTHSPQSVCLSDGRIFTVFMHDTRYSWTDQEGHPWKDKLTLGHPAHVSVVIWHIPDD